MAHLPVDFKAPGHGGGLTPQLPVDEVADATGEQPQTRQWRAEIKDVGDVAALADGEDRQRAEHPEHAAVKGHPALPNLERVPRVVLPVAQAVEQHVADAPAKDHAEHRGKAKM